MEQDYCLRHSENDRRLNRILEKVNLLAARKNVITIVEEEPKPVPPIEEDEEDIFLFLLYPIMFYCCHDVFIDELNKVVI